MFCDADDQCNFFFWRIDNECTLYETCNVLKEKRTPGTIFAKNGLCSGILSIFSVYTSNYIDIKCVYISQGHISVKILLYIFRRNEGKMATNKMF